MTPVTCTTEEMIPVTLAPKTLTGKPATLDGAPVWSVVSGSGTVVPSADGLSANLKSTDTVDGVPTVFMVDGDADLGAGVIDLQETFELTTTNANAASLGVVVGAAVPKV